jgi:hypothetical protein
MEHWRHDTLQVIHNMDVRAHLQVTTLMVNEGSSRCGVHHDPPAPLPALIAGCTAWERRDDGAQALPMELSHHMPECALSPPPSPLASPHAPMLAHGGGAWERKQKGGRLFLLDGLFDLEYGPRDVLLLDGRFAHGVTTLRGLPHTVGSHTQLERHSLILFSRWQREKMKGEKRLRDGLMSVWDDAWLSSVPFSQTASPTSPELDSELPRSRKAPDRYGGSTPSM